MYNSTVEERVPTIAPTGLSYKPGFLRWSPQVEVILTHKKLIESIIIIESFCY